MTKRMIDTLTPKDMSLIRIAVAWDADDVSKTEVILRGFGAWARPAEEDQMAVWIAKAKTDGLKVFFREPLYTNAYAVDEAGKTKRGFNYKVLDTKLLEEIKDNAE